MYNTVIQKPRRGLRRVTLASSVVILLTAVLLSPLAQAAGLLTPTNGNLEQLSIKEHHVDVMIEDGYAVTTVSQVFKNPHNQALEAIYSFPVPEKASVGEFTYWIDGTPVTGEVLEAQKARDIYEQEKAQGRETALVEKDVYRTFDASVYPVQPQDEVKIRMVYIQPVPTDLGIGRYVYPLEEGGVDEEKLAFWSYNENVDEAFSFNLEMRSSYPIDTFRLPKHPQAQVNKTSAQEWQVAFANGAASALEETTESTQSPVKTAFTLDTDIVVYWRHEQGLPGAVDMVTYRDPGSDRGTFMLTVTPGDDLGPITQGRDWIFVLDYSGSMQGKYPTLIEGVRQGLAKLDPLDRYRVILFNNSTQEVTNGYHPAQPGEIERTMAKLEAINPTGGTNLYAGLEKGYRSLDSDRASAVILVTDGVANVGVTEKVDFLKLLEAYDVRLYSFVMGNSANRPLLEGMTKVSNGFSVNVSNSDDIVGLLVQTADKLNHEAYRDIDVRIKGVKVADVTPANIGSLYRGQQLTLFGHYWGDGPAEVTIRGEVSGEKRQYRSVLEFPETQTLNPELERLWAFAAIEALQGKMDYLGEDPDTRTALVDIALEHGLVTNHTSMIVLRDEVFAEHGIARNNASRVEKEQIARQARQQQAVRSHRQDANQPAFSQPRSYPSSGKSGGGSLGPLGVILLLPLLFLAGKRRMSRYRVASPEA